MVKVLHIITRLDKGGSSENTLLTCIGLDKNRFEVSLLVGETVDACQDLITEAKSSGVRFIFIPELVRNIKPLKDIKSLFRISSLIKREKYDIVHTHSSKAGFIGRLAAKVGGVSLIIYTPHGHIFYGYFNWVLTKIFVYMEKLAAFYTDKIICLTQASQDEWIKFRIAKRDKFIAIHSGVRFKDFKEPKIDLERKKEELGIPINSKIVATVGRLVPIKGHRYLIEAIPKIINEYPEVIFLLIGDGPLKINLQKQVKILNLEQKVEFLGWRDDLFEILKTMDIFVFPSLNEGMGRVLVEAMACALPVVASCVGGIPSVVINGKTGLLVPSGDSNSLSRAIISLLKNPEPAKMMGVEGKKWVLSNFSFEQMVRKIGALYQDLLSKVPR